MNLLKKISFILVRLAVSVALLFLLFRRIKFDGLLLVLKESNAVFLGLALFAFFLNYLFCFFRWDILLRGLKINISRKKIFTAFCGGLFFNLFLPTTIGGDIIRSLDLSSHTKRAPLVIATVLLDRLSGYTAVMAMALVAVLFFFRLIGDISVLAYLLIIASFLIIVLVILFNEYLYSKISRLFAILGARKGIGALSSLHQEIHLLKNNPAVLFNALVVSFWVHIFSTLTSYFIAVALGLNISIIYFLVFLPIIGAIAIMPFSLGGLGLRDFATIFLFAKAGVGNDKALAMSLLLFFFISLHAVLGGIAYVFTVHYRRV